MKQSIISSYDRTAYKRQNDPALNDALRKYITNGYQQLPLASKRERIAPVGEYLRSTTSAANRISSSAGLQTSRQGPSKKIEFNQVQQWIPSYQNAQPRRSQASTAPAKSSSRPKSAPKHDALGEKNVVERRREKPQTISQSTQTKPRQETRQSVEPQLRQYAAEMLIKNELIQSNQRLLSTLQNIQDSCYEATQKRVKINCSYEMVKSRIHNNHSDAALRECIRKEKRQMDHEKHKGVRDARQTLKRALGTQKLIEWKQPWNLTPNEADAILTICDKNAISQSQLIQIFNQIQAQFDKFQTSNLSKAQALAGLRALGSIPFAILKSATDMIDENQEECLRPSYFVIVFLYAWCQKNLTAEKHLRD